MGSGAADDHEAPGSSRVTRPQQPTTTEGAAIYHTLQRGNVQHRIDTDLWLCVLDLAASRGWTPLPTESPTGALAAYARPAGATISDEDAMNLASCLEAGLPTIDDQQVPLGDHAFGEEHTEALLSRRVEGQEVHEGDVRAAREILSGAPKQDAERLAAFLKGGAFSVA